MSNIAISFIILNYNTINLTNKCIECIKNSIINFSYEIIVIDNNSNDGSVEFINKLHDDVILIENKINYGFGKANNIGANKARGKYLFLINSDAFVTTYAINILINILEKNNDIDVVAPKLLNKNGTIQKSALANYSFLLQIIYLTYFDKLLKYIFRYYFRDRFDNYYCYRQYPVIVIGACFVLRRNKFIEMKGFDENYFFCFEEYDLLKRIYDYNNIALIPEAEVIHLGGASTESLNDFALFNCLLGCLKYYIKWKGHNYGFIIYIFSIYYYLIHYLCFSNKSINSMIDFLQNIIKLKKEGFLKNKARHDILGVYRHF
jgi:GT2 family glycosyltransferase